MTLYVRYHGMTDSGKTRKSNQDHFLTARLNKSMIVDHSSIAQDDQARFLSETEGRLLLVADGMGGHASGEIASQLAIDSAAAYVLNTIPWFYRLSHDCDEDFRDELKRAIEFCQRQLEDESRLQPNHRGMGTTLTMAYILGDSLYVVHVGDSRCYLYRGNQLHQLTRDHTLAQTLIDAGQLSSEIAGHSRLSHVLWNAIGGSEHSDLKPDVYKCELAADDQILLCTDGLYRHVTDDSIKTTLDQGLSLERKCERLIADANHDGGTDNITVVLACVESFRDQKHHDAHAVTRVLS